MEVPSLAPQCPWYELSEMAKPNVKWCEASQCSWITEPANTWSNLAFVFAGMIIWYLARKKGQKSLALFGPVAIFVGACSFVYHMSYTMVLQTFDFIAMYAFVGILLIFNLRRLEKISKERQTPFFIGLVLACTALFMVFYALQIPMQIIVAVLVVAFIATEFMARKRLTTKPNSKHFIIAFASLGVALTFTLLDVTRTWCDPNNHVVQGHALWHVFNSITIFFIYKYFEQFSFDEDKIRIVK